MIPGQKYTGEGFRVSGSLPGSIYFRLTVKIVLLVFILP